jgi:hypothetical protein
MTPVLQFKSSASGFLGRFDDARGAVTHQSGRARTRTCCHGTYRTVHMTHDDWTALMERTVINWPGISATKVADLVISL